MKKIDELKWDSRGLIPAVDRYSEQNKTYEYYNKSRPEYFHSIWSLYFYREFKIRFFPWIPNMQAKASLMDRHIVVFQIQSELPLNLTNLTRVNQ